MIKQPNIHSHMAKWGFLSGTILAVLLMTFISTFDGAGGLIALIFPPVWILAVMFGGIPGTILGAIEASFMKRHLEDAPLDFTKQDMQRYRGRVYQAAAGVPLAMHIALSIFFGVISGAAGTGFGYLALFAIPTAIASVASIYAAHRYLFRLRLHGMRLMNSGYNSKEKFDYNTHRLEDGTAYETARYDNDDDNNGTYLVQG